MLDLEILFINHCYRIAKKDVEDANRAISFLNSSLSPKPFYEDDKGSSVFQLTEDGHVIDEYICYLVVDIPLKKLKLQKNQIDLIGVAS